MKVSLNIKVIEGPYGGGMQFARYMENFLKSRGCMVTHDLKDRDIDFILHINPFPFKSKASAYSFWDAYIYKLKHPDAIIIQRINECDERKKTNFMNKLLVQTSRYSDYLVFIASWLKPLMENTGLGKNKPGQVILNGADENIFNMEDKMSWNGKEKMKIVTHHWGGNYLKGHDIYKKLDDLLALRKFKDKFEFTFIGNYPKDISYKNTRLIPPLSGEKLAQELKKHHVYLTASRNEPAGMHHIEGAMCGLPLLYINSGALPEYCDGFGIEFTENNFEERLEQIGENYEKLFAKVKDYENSAQKMAGEYSKLISFLNENRKKFSLKKNIIARYLELCLVSIFKYFYHLYWKIRLTMNNLWRTIFK